MHKFKVNDIVIYKLKLDNKEKNNNLYTIIKIKEETYTCIIQGLNYRIILEANINDLEIASLELIEKCKELEDKYRNRVINSSERNKNSFLLGKILHIDGDDKYLHKCLKLYDEIGVYAYGVKLSEESVASEVTKYLYEINPDIVVITGHDFLKGEDLKDINSYKNTQYFINAVKEIRKSNQTCCIIAGACQSNYEALIASGADFASSPGRINIHIYDPAIIAIKVATTSFRQIVDTNNIYKYIENGRKAFGGLQTTGKMRLIL